MDRRRRAGDEGGFRQLQAVVPVMEETAVETGLPLVLAMRAGEPGGLLALLLEDGVDPCDTDAAGLPPLCFAAAEGRAEAASLLLRHGADPLLPTPFGKTPLFVATQCQHEGFLDMLLRWGVDNGRDVGIDTADANGWTPLTIGAVHGAIGSLRMLLDAGADPNICTETGWGPLMFAASGCFGADGAEAVGLLLDHGADIHAGTHRGFTPLLHAVAYRNLAIVRLLLARGADANAGSPLVHSLLKPDASLAVVVALLDAGARPDDSFNGITPLIMAAKQCEPAIVETLIRRGATVDLKDSWGSTPLSFAAESENGGAADALMAAGAEPSFDESGWTPRGALFLYRRAADAARADGEALRAFQRNIPQLVLWASSAAASPSTQKRRKM